MPEFNPEPNDTITIGGHTYTVQPHPAVPTFAFGQEGRKAFVYQLRGGPDDSMYAIKKFKHAYRLPELVGINDELDYFARWKGLEVCHRVCLEYGIHTDALAKFPDLEFAVIMPWIVGTTWYDVVVGERPLSKLDAVSYATSVSQVLAALEEGSIAHCDISAANVIISTFEEGQAHAHLIDVEDLYSPDFQPPAALPAGTDGYAHKTAYDGQWGPAADRFAGAILMSEMAAWHSPAIRKQAHEEHYFAPDELQQDTPRYQLMLSTLGEFDARLADLFRQAWESETLEDCPRLNIWQDVFEDVFPKVRAEPAVSGWQSLMPAGMEAAPAAEQPASVQPAPAPAPVAEPESEIEADVVPEPVADVEPASQPAPAVDVQPSAVSLPEYTPPPAMPTNPVTLPTGGRPKSRPPVTFTPGKPILPQPGKSPVSDWVQFLPSGDDSTTAEQTSPQQVSFQPLGEEAVEVEPEPLLEPDTEPEPLFEDIAAEEEVEPIVEDYEPEPELEPQPLPEEPEIEESDEPLTFDADMFGADSDEDDADSFEPTDSFEPPDPSTMFEDILPAPQLQLDMLAKRNRPQLSWSAVPDATHYCLQESKNEHFIEADEHVFKADKHEWKPLLGRSGQVYYRVRAEAAGDPGLWSETLALNIE